MNGYGELFYYDRRTKRRAFQVSADFDWRWWEFGASVGTGKNVYDLRLHLSLGPIDFEFLSWGS